MNIDVFWLNKKSNLEFFKAVRMAQFEAVGDVASYWFQSVVILNIVASGVIF